MRNSSRLQLRAQVTLRGGGRHGENGIARASGQKGYHPGKVFSPCVMSADNISPGPGMEFSGYRVDTDQRQPGCAAIILTLT